MWIKTQRGGFLIKAINIVNDEYRIINLLSNECYMGKYDDCDVLGQYSRERCQEIFEEIQTAIMLGKNLFIMPEE